jgi:hypothetical protein
MNPGCAATLRAFHSAFVSSFVPDSLTATLASVMLLATGLAAVAAPFLMRGYVAQIRRLMVLHQVVEPPESWFRRLWRATAAPGDSPSSPVAVEELQRAAAARLAAIRRATWCAYAMFVIPAPAWLLTAPSHPLADVIGFCVATPILAAVPVFVNVRPQGSKTLVLAGMVVLGLVLGATEPTDNGRVANVVLVTLLLGALYFVTAHRQLRSIAVLTAVWLTAALGGVLAGLWLASPSWLCTDDAAGLGEWSLAAGGLILAVAAVIGCAYAGREMMKTAARLVERGVLSDISLAAGAGLTVIAMLLAFAISGGGPFSKWQIAAGTGAWIGASIGCYGAVLRRQTRPRAQRSLLVLRVFSNTRAAERLLDVVQARWRYIGPVFEIAGPDLVRLNIDAHEFSKFVSSRLYEEFFMGAVDERQLAARLVTTPDREGRFRVNEVFCFETAWRRTVEELMQMSDAILLDLHGFTRERHGAVFEIDLLARHGLLPRLLAVGDSSTNWQQFDALFRQAGTAPDDAARMVVARDAGEGVVSALMRVATGAAEPLPQP